MYLDHFVQAFHIPPAYSTVVEDWLILGICFLEFKVWCYIVHQKASSLNPLCHRCPVSHQNTNNHPKLVPIDLRNPFKRRNLQSFTLLRYLILVFSIEKASPSLGSDSIKKALLSARWSSFPLFSMPVQTKFISLCFTKFHGSFAALIWSC